MCNKVVHTFSCGHQTIMLAECASSRTAPCGVMNVKHVKHEDRCDSCDNGCQVRFPLYLVVPPCSRCHSYTELTVVRSACYRVDLIRPTSYDNRCHAKRTS
ncbi:hypothetical protein M501DRAFT_934308 [Patellaria atrata CBS 101060]|uniref:Uncharacterized protein n=1 Tax=Patellaria atrata CBS 101060 TaxID=1346257 RepID=A0A9P4VS20_9PEZI|nr:hypothetical protein M501DRAFT_934308 [Patellaria atrata CBS 101060]